jgi:hypothetical protein
MRVSAPREFAINGLLKNKVTGDKSVLTRAELAARRVGVSVRHARRLLAEGDDRVADLIDLPESEVQRQAVKDLLARLAKLYALLCDGFGGWRLLVLDDLLAEGKGVLSKEEMRLVREIVKAYDAAGDPIQRLYKACDALLRRFDPELDAMLREDEAHESQRATEEIQSLLPEGETELKEKIRAAGRAVADYLERAKPIAVTAVQLPSPSSANGGNGESGNAP